MMNYLRKWLPKYSNKKDDKEKTENWKGRKDNGKRKKVS